MWARSASPGSADSRHGVAALALGAVGGVLVQNTGQLTGEMPGADAMAVAVVAEDAEEVGKLAL